MKTYYIEDLLKKDLLILELPEGYHYHVNKKGICIQGLDKSDWTVFKGSYTLLGKADEIREEEAKELVEQSIHTGLFAHYVKDIPVNTYCYKTATESLLSAIESVIFWDVNPIDIKGQTFSSEHTNRWEEAQSRTFDRNRTLIFVKN